MGSDPRYLGARGGVRFTGYIEETRYIPTVSSRPAQSTLRLLCHNTRLSNASRIGYENVGLLLYLMFSLALVYIFVFGLTGLCFDLIGLVAPALRSAVAWTFTALALFGSIVMTERHRPGFLKRLVWQFTIFLFGWPRQRQRMWLCQVLRVPVDIDVELDAEQPNIRWRARREDGSTVRTVQLSQLPQRVAPPPGVSRDGRIDLLEDGLTLELTRDPSIDGRAHLRLRAPRSHDGLDLTLEVDGQQAQTLSPMSRSGVWLEDKDQQKLVDEIVQIALSVGAKVPQPLKISKVRVPVRVQVTTSQ